MTAKQKEIILLMRDGAIVSKPGEVYRHFQTLKPCLEKQDGELIEFSTVTFHNILDAGLIERDKSNGQKHIPLYYYKLTELGKTIQL